MKRTCLAGAFAALMSISTAFAEHDAIAVEYVTAVEQDMVATIELTGSIEARDSVDLGFRQSGRVIEVLVEEGDHVARDQPLARLDSVQQEQGRKVAEASLAAARAALAQARQASDRAEAMLSRGVGTRAARDAAAQALSEAQGAVERAESALEQANRAVSDTVLVAPDDAVVTARNIAPGQIVGAAQPVLSLAELEGLEAVFQSADLPLLDKAMGTQVRLEAIDFDMPAMTGTVTEISPLVDPQLGTVAVRAEIDNGDGAIELLGAAVRGHMRISTSSGVLVPWTALTRHGDGAAVWLVEGEQTRLVPVEISNFGDKGVFLSAGVEAGQVVVGAGSQLLYPGRGVHQATVLP
ncbi:efflux RND transporter periplasmic adaptor subunit [Paracoccus siganidrum]|uniref:Efflux RND transporter periplasmic adaptor subunit n=2 Tax=Paracoccus siganidrum TaxID=1276757 RepID=A0A419A485_9RHOB|nr:efflux RND transporter periplasmic adaptor subunit [Paracoccus siganidrum]RMC31530.1 efflux RND transporter periplasmic adaptor subunit [Paracoccus siganidrum]